jgi:rhomboid family GlyGly-CTERM serine protease
MQLNKPIAFCGVLLAAGLMFCEPVARWLQYDHAAIANGQIWRLGTCHLTHWTATHALWSILTFAGLCVVCEERSRRRSGGVVAGSALLISVSIFILRPDVPTYRGLSGIDSALFCLLAMMILRRSEGETTRFRRAVQRSIAIIALAGFAGKLSYEMIVGQALFAQSAGELVPLPLAHLIGSAIGFIGGVFGRDSAPMAFHSTVIEPELA